MNKTEIKAEIKTLSEEVVMLRKYIRAGNGNDSTMCSKLSSKKFRLRALYMAYAFLKNTAYGDIECQPGTISKWFSKSRPTQMARYFVGLQSSPHVFKPKEDSSTFDSWLQYK